MKLIICVEPTEIAGIKINKKIKEYPEIFNSFKNKNADLIVKLIEKILTQYYARYKIKMKITHEVID